MDASVSRTSPAVLVQQQVDDWCEDERAQPRTADGQARGERSLLLKVVRHTRDGRQVDQAKTGACKSVR